MAGQLTFVVNLQPPDANVPYAGNRNPLVGETGAQCLVDVIACPCRVTAFNNCGNVGGSVYIGFVVAQESLPDARINAFRQAN